MARRLAAGPSVTMLAVHGMGGVGKTQLAVEYAYAHAGDYDMVWWVTADEPALIPDQFAAMAAELGLVPESDPDLVRAQVHGQLRKVGGWLVIFDNAGSVDDIREWLPSVPVPAGARGHVIITTRQGGFASLGRVLDLDVIESGDAVGLLRTRVPELEQETGKLIAEELGWLPLALEQAAAYMDRTQMPATEYLELLQNRPVEMYERGRAGDRPDTIATLWDISLKRISSENPAAVQLLDICAYLDPRPVPLDLFTAHPDQLPEPLSEVAADPLAFADAIGIVVDYSLAKRTTVGLQMHRLVQAAIRTRHIRQASSHRAQVMSPMSAEQTGPPAPLAATLGLLRADAPRRILRAPQDWPRWAVLLPHVLAASALAGQAIGAGHDMMADTAWLLDRAGVYLHEHAQFADARALLERALAIAETVYGPSHPEVARRLNNLASTLHDLGSAEDARPLQERALAIAEATHGPDHPDVAIDLHNLALTLLDLGLAAEARPLQERALALTEQDYGPDHSEVAVRLNNLAHILRDLALAEQARPLQERALAIAEAAHGPDHPDVAIDLHNLALILLDLGLAAEARPLQERSLTIIEKVYGPDHPSVVGSLYSLAAILQHLGRAEDARALQARALANSAGRSDCPDGPRDPGMGEIR